MAGFKSAFFAFPSEPAELSNPILAAVELMKSNPSLNLRAWPQLSIFGAAIPSEVKAGIENANVLVCDITQPNLNVYYEVGYSLGLGKSLAPVLNVSFANASTDVQKNGLFDIIGYKVYENSQALADILADLPSTVLVDLYGKALNTHQPIFLLNAFRKTDFVTQIATAIKGSKVFFRSFDPAEDPRFTIIQTISEITASAGVIVPFLEPYVDDADRHNVRAAFLAGLAHGLGRETLLIRHRTTDAVPAAIDFRDDVVGVRNESEVAEKVIAFCKQTLIAAQSIKKPNTSASRSALQQLTLGATAAENEFRTLEDYFVATSEYLKTSRGEAGIVAGRKGSGKTAIFFMVRDHFRRHQNAIVVDLKPESHQLSLFKNELKKILDVGTFDHTIAAFWHFVILSEVLLALSKELEFQLGRRTEVQDEVEEVRSALRRLEISTSGDFTARINRLGSYVVQEIKARAEKRETLSPEKLTNIVASTNCRNTRRYASRSGMARRHGRADRDGLHHGLRVQPRPAGRRPPRR